MHVFLACLYAVLLWLSLMAYLLITGGPHVTALVLAPVLISGGALALLALDGLIMVGAWAARAAWRRWRSVPRG